MLRTVGYLSYVALTAGLASDAEFLTTLIKDKLAVFVIGQLKTSPKYLLIVTTIIQYAFSVSREMVILLTITDA